MNLRLARSAPIRPLPSPPEPARDATPSTHSAADAWLDVFTTLLRLPARQTAEVRDELGDHLRNRVRDLILLGTPEPDAVRRAVAELGDAADLAARYRHARTDPTRRTIMYGSLLGLSGAALIVGSAALFTGPRTDPPQDDAARQETARFVVDMLAARAANEPEPMVITDLLAHAGEAAQRGNNPELLGYLRARTAEALALQASRDDFPGAQVLWPEAPGGHDAETIGGVSMDVDFDQVTLSDALQFLEKVLGDRPVRPDWARLEQLGLQRDTAVTIRGSKMSLPEFFTALNQTLTLPREQAVDFRFSNRVMEIADRETFDRREITLAVYDLAPVLAARGVQGDDARSNAIEEVTGVIKTFVEPASWVDNGGDLARLKVVGDRLFVEAPRRFHKRIGWIIGRLPAGEEHSRRPVPPADGLTTELVPLQHIAPHEAITRLHDHMKQNPADRLNCNLAPDYHTNSVLAQAAPDDMARILQILRNADAQGTTPEAPAR